MKKLSKVAIKRANASYYAILKNRKPFVKVIQKAIYKGKYFFACETCKVDSNKASRHDRFLTLKLDGLKEIEKAKTTHQNHRWILIHESKLTSYTYKTPNKKKILFAWGKLFS